MKHLETRLQRLESFAMPGAGTLPATVPDNATESERLALVVALGRPVYRFEEVVELFV